MYFLIHAKFYLILLPLLWIIIVYTHYNGVPAVSHMSHSSDEETLMCKSYKELIYTHVHDDTCVVCLKWILDMLWCIYVYSMW